MTLFTRLGRLFRADINAVLDGLEEPTLLLRQAVRDMEDVLTGEQAAHDELAAELQRLAAALDDSRDRAAALDEELSLCLAADKNELARDLVRRKLEIARHAAQLMERQQAHRDTLRRIDAQLNEHRQRLASLRAQAALHERSSVVGAADGVAGWAAAAPISDAEIEVALLRERQRRAQS
jgi:phage shock protein A